MHQPVVLFKIIFLVWDFALLGVMHRFVVLFEIAFGILFV
jgi:hypothetical protein